MAGLRRRDLPARHRARARADDAAGAGRQRDRRQGRRQPSARQEHDRRLLPAARRRRRPGGARHAAAARVPRRAVRSDQVRNDVERGALRSDRQASGRRFSRGRPEALTAIISESCRIKADVVSADEREAGPRRILNFGHTAGHAIEAVTKYRRYRHGEAVGYGMLVAAELAAARGALADRDRQALADLMASLGPAAAHRRHRGDADRGGDAARQEDRVRTAALRAADRDRRDHDCRRCHREGSEGGVEESRLQAVGDGASRP